jgi:hypothetical protein
MIRSLLSGILTRSPPPFAAPWSLHTGCPRSLKLKWLYTLLLLPLVYVCLVLDRRIRLSYIAVLTRAGALATRRSIRSS